MIYVDGFVLPVPRKKLPAYKKLAQQAARTWRKYGALEYVEAVADDVPDGKVTSFGKAVKLKKDEVVVFAYVIYKSRKHRDAVIKKVMADPSMNTDPKLLPFDGMRMFWGGFKQLVKR